VRGAKEPLLPEPRGVEGGAAQGQRALETQKRCHPRLPQTARFRGLDVYDEISNNLPFKFSQSAEDVEDKLSATGCGVDILLQGLKPYPLLMKRCDRVDEVSEGPAKPVKPPHYKRISFSQVAESLCEAFALLFGTR
jgi:hypothetical protein